MGETVATRLQQPSPIGEGGIPATFQVRMNSATADSVSLTTTTTYDAGALRATTVALVRQSGAPVTAAEPAKIPAVQVNDEGKYTFDRKLGVMREVVINRRVSSGNEQRLDGWVIRLVTQPGR